MATNNNLRRTITGIIMACFLIFFAFKVASLPVGPTITYISNTTMVSTGTGLTDGGGYIHTINLNTLQQNYAWKAYVGNVSGQYTLDDADGATIYNWALPDSMIVGEVYVTRNATVDFLSINCSNQTVSALENARFGFGQSDNDSINATFNLSIHQSFNVGTRAVVASTCKSLFTFINDTYQPEAVASNFSEVMLTDRHYGLIYSTVIESDATGFNNASYDFQLIVPENESATTATTYYFYVEIGG